MKKIERVIKKIMTLEDREMKNLVIRMALIVGVGFLSYCGQKALEDKVSNHDYAPNYPYYDGEVLKMDTQQQNASALLASNGFALQARHFKNETPVSELIGSNNTQSYNKANHSDSPLARLSGVGRR